MILLPVQYGLVGLVGSLYSEPWPVLVMPGFQRIWDASDAFVVPDVVIEAHFADGSHTRVSHKALLFDLPRSHHRAFLEAWFRPPGSYATLSTEGILHPESGQWLRTRLDLLYPGRRAVRLDARWIEVVYRPTMPEQESIHTPLDTFSIDLPLP